MKLSIAVALLLLSPAISAKSIYDLNQASQKWYSECVSVCEIVPLENRGPCLQPCRDYFEMFKITDDGLFLPKDFELGNISLKSQQTIGLLNALRYQKPADQYTALVQTQEPYFELLTCAAKCDLSDELCQKRCVDDATNELQSTLSRFKNDEGFNFDEVEYPTYQDTIEYMNDLKGQCDSQCEGNQDCIDACNVYRDVLNQEIFAFDLEKRSKITFDEFAVANLDPFEEFEICKKQCVQGDFECLTFCNEQLQKSLDNQVFLSLSMQDQIEYKQDVENAKRILQCFYTAQNETDAQICQEQADLFRPESLKFYLNETVLDQHRVVIECYAQAETQQDLQNCLDLSSQLSQDFPQIDVQAIVEQVQSEVDELKSCLANATTEEKLIQCWNLESHFQQKYGVNTEIPTPQALWSIELNDQEKVEASEVVAQLLNESAQIQAELPQLKEVVKEEVDVVFSHADTHYKQLDQDLLEIQKMLSIKALMNLQSQQQQDVDQLIRDEIARRKQLAEELLTKELSILRDLAQQKFEEATQQEWYKELQNVDTDRAECQAACAEECFAAGGDPLTILEECVIPKCECQETLIDNSTIVSLAAIDASVGSFAEYKIKAENERLLKEHQRDHQVVGDFRCGVECLDAEVPFDIKEICLERLCGAHLNLFYKAKVCDMTCASNCLFLSFNDYTRTSQCLHQCGCDTTPQGDGQQMNLMAVQTPASSLTQQASPDNFYLNILLSIAVAVFLSGSFLTFKKVRKTLEKNQVVKQADIKLQRKEKILEDEETFEVEENYERVA